MHRKRENLIAMHTASPCADSPTVHIVASVVERTPTGALEAVKRGCSSGADIVELRLDFLHEPFNHVHELVRSAQAIAPVIATVRASWEGGVFSGTEEERMQLLSTAASAGASYIDCELDASERLWHILPDDARADVSVVLSWHEFDRVPSIEELNAAYNRAVDAGADVVKLAATAARIEDISCLWSALQYQHSAGNAVPIVALAMGEAGLVTRLLAGKLGSVFTFGSVDSGSEAAPGQVTVGELRSLYKAPEVSGSTPVYGVIGNPVAHSRSPSLHNRALQHTGANGVYVPYLVHDLQSFLHTSPFNEQDYAGFSITVPHKEAAMSVCTHIDPLAQEIGAVNTLIRQSDGSLHGYNTDCDAAMDAMEAGLGSTGTMSGKVLVIVGAGGAGRALAIGALRRNAHVIIANRNTERAHQLAKDVGRGAMSIGLEELSSTDTLKSYVSGNAQLVLANSTSVGMEPNEDQTPVDGTVLSAFTLVFDAVYTPLETRLLKDAKTAGCTTASGLDMFVGQAARQFELFTGKAAPVEEMRKVTLASLGYNEGSRLEEQAIATAGG